MVETAVVANRSEATTTALAADRVCRLSLVIGAIVVALSTLELTASVLGADGILPRPAASPLTPDGVSACLLALAAMLICLGLRGPRWVLSVLGAAAGVTAIVAGVGVQAGALDWSAFTSTAGAVSLLLLGGALLLPAHAPRRVRTILYAAGMLPCLLVVAGHVYGVSRLRDLPGTGTISLPAAVQLLAIGIGAAAWVDGGLVQRMLLGSTAGSRVERLIIGAAALAVPVLGLIGEADRPAHRSGSLAAALTGLLGAIIAGWLATIAARRVDERDHHREAAATQMLADIAERDTELERLSNELRQAEHDVAANRERYRRLFDAAPLGLIEQTADGTIQIANVQWAAMHGITADDAVGRRLPPNLLPADRADVEAWLDHPEPFSRMRYRIVNGNLDVRHLMCDRMSVYDAEGALLHNVSAVRDLTTADRARRHDQALRRMGQSLDPTLDRHELLHTAFTELRAALGVTFVGLASVGAGAGQTNVETAGPADHMVRFNDVMAAALGSTASFARDGGAVDWLTIDTGAASQLSQIGCSCALLVPLRIGEEESGVIVLADYSARRWSAEDRDLAATLGQDIASALIRAEVRRRERLSLQRLEQVDAARTEFFTAITNELRQPLGGLLHQLDEVLLSEGDLLRAPLRKGLTAARRDAQRVSEFIDDLLSIASVEQSRLAETPGPVAIAAVVDNAVAQLRGDAAAKHVSLHSKVRPGMRPVRGKPRQLEQLLQIVLDNAVRYTPTEGTVELAAWADGDSTLIEVRDTGIGIPADEIDRVSGRFYRATNVPCDVAGTGVGLTIAARIARDHGGTLTLSSSVAGTTALIALPNRMSAPVGEASLAVITESSELDATPSAATRPRV